LDLGFQRPKDERQPGEGNPRSHVGVGLRIGIP